MNGSFAYCLIAILARCPVFSLHTMQNYRSASTGHGSFFVGLLEMSQNDIHISYCNYAVYVEGCQYVNIPNVVVCNITKTTEQKKTKLACLAEFSYPV